MTIFNDNIDKEILRICTDTPITYMTTVIKTETINYEGVSPYNLGSWLKANNIPKDCYFSDDNFISYDISIDMSYKKIITDTQRRNWASTVFRKVYKFLTEIGYNRKSPDTYIKCPYTLFINGEYETLLKYYFSNFYIPTDLKD